MTRCRAVAACVLLALLLAACGRVSDAPTTRRAPAANANAAPNADALELGRKVYNFRCYFCHGYSGDAKTLAASYLMPPPRDFTQASPDSLPLPMIVAAVRDGRPGTAMKAFHGILGDAELHAVAAFVAAEFVREKARNTSYHTRENGWPDHERYAAAFPFARGDVKLDTPVESLSGEQLSGRSLFLSSCISCHDRAHVHDEGPAWSARPLSYPRMGFTPGQAPLPEVDAVSSASVYARHDVVPRMAGLDARQRRGETLFQANCAFCHGADGSGKNWIGQFMQPKARDLTLYTPRTMPIPRLRAVIRDGLPQTSMPAWKSVLAPDEIDAVAAYVARAFFRADGR